MEISHIGIHESARAIFPPERLRDALSDLGPRVSVVGSDDLAGVDALATFEYHDAFLDVDLRWIHSVVAGVDRFDIDAIESAGVVLTNSTGVHRESVGETALGTMLMFARRLHDAVANQQSNTWERPAWDEPFTLDGESLCVVGLGALGQGIAERADALGVDVVGVRRSDRPADGVRRIYTPDRLHDAISDVTFVALAVPLTDETRHLFGPAEFDAMRDDAYLLNVARGGVVDQSALVDALESGTIRGAGLDVFEEEPLPADSPLWGMDEVIVTPHVGGADRNYAESMATLLRENVGRIEEGTEMTNRVV